MASVIKSWINEGFFMHLYKKTQLIECFINGNFLEQAFLIQ